MEIQEILQLPVHDLIPELSKREDKDFAEFLNQYNPETHAIHDTTIRPKKIINKSVNGEETLVVQDVTRIALPFQKIIVDRAATFLIGEGVLIVSDAENDNEERVYKMVQQISYDTKMDYKTRKITRTLFSETEVAELWYLTDEANAWTKLLKKLNLSKKLTKRMRMQILSYSNGDELFPHFNVYGDMDAFSRKYSVNGKEYFDVYTAERIINYRKDDGRWKEIKNTQNEIGKIPVIYYSQPDPEWKDVQSAIERLEVLISNFADQNDYFASPMVLVKGVVQGFAEKGESGKMIILQEDAEVKYLTWDQAPEAIKLEIDTLTNFIFSMTQTANHSWSEMKGIGNASGTALKLMFLDPEHKALKHQEIIGEGIQRRLNLLKACVSVIDPSLKEATEMINLTPEFRFYMPGNDAEIVQSLAQAMGGGRAIISRETAVKYNPYVTNSTDELEKIKEDELGNAENLIDY